MQGTFRALRHRPFTLLLSGRTISALGDRLFSISLAWWVMEETGSAVVLSTILVFGVIPMLAFLLLGGALVDRLPRVRLMLASDLARGVLVSVLGLLAWLKLLEVWHIYGLSLIFGLVEAFFQPAYRAALPEITPADDLPSANSLTSLSSELSGIAGPAIGAIIVALVGAPFAFILNGLSFFISGICLLPILPLDPAPSGEARARNILGDVHEGLRAVLASPWLWVTIMVAGISNITASGPLDVGLPFLIREHLHADVGVLGSFYSLMSIGAIVGAIWIGRSTKIRRRGLKLYGSWIMTGVVLVVMGLPINTAVLLVAAFAMGVFQSLLALIWTNTLQECVPRQLLGRVSSVDYLGSYILLPIGFAVGGWAIEAVGPAPVFIVGGACTTALIAAGLLHPQIRRMD
jgi:MFS family permease